MSKLNIYAILATIVMIISCSCGSPAEPEPEGISQETKDAYVGYGFVNCFWFIWNQNIAGTPVGAKDLTVAGPQGGTVHIYGTNGLSGDINTCDLTLDMTDCRSSRVDYDLTFTGSISCVGSFSPSYCAMGYNSEMLSYTGTVDNENTNTAVEDVGPIAITETQSSLCGTICGRSFASH